MATQLGAIVNRMITPGSKKQLVICETQPVTAEGIRAALAGCEDLEFHCAVDSLGAATEQLKKGVPELLLIDKSFGAQAVLHWLSEQRPQLAGVGLVIWGSAITEPEALRLLQLGVKGILRKSAEMATLVACLRAVAAGANWMEDALFRDAPRSEGYARTFEQFQHPGRRPGRSHVERPDRDPRGGTRRRDRNPDPRRRPAVADRGPGVQPELRDAARGVPL